ncbi:MAG: hypothetical protein ACOYX1_00005, partial [Acidobacteriota bacterium]
SSIWYGLSKRLSPFFSQKNFPEGYHASRGESRYFPRSAGHPRAGCEEHEFLGFGPVYIDPAGDLVGIEYRHLGIYIRPLEDGKVDYISYSSGPAGLDSDPCPKEKPRRRK